MRYGHYPGESLRENAGFLGGIKPPTFPIASVKTLIQLTFRIFTTGKLFNFV